MALDHQRTGAGEGGVQWFQEFGGTMVSMSPFFPASHLLPGGIEAVFPVWLAANLDQDVAAHEILNLRGQPFLVIQNRGAVEVAFTSQRCQRFTFDQAVDYGLIPC